MRLSAPNLDAFYIHINNECPRSHAESGNQRFNDDCTMHVCLFDIDGTLLSTGGAGQAAMEAALRAEFGIQDVAAQGIPTAGRTDRAIIADLLESVSLAVTAENVARFLKVYLEHLPAHLKNRPGSVLPGIPQLLDALSGREDILLGLLTGNFREGARLKLEHYRLHHHFGFGGFGDRHLERDDVAREALNELRKRYDGELVMQHVWVIGDTPADVRCARAIGARVFAVATGSYSAEELEASGPDFLVRDFRDAEPLLNVLND